MSETQCKLGSLLIQDHYGDVVEKVCTHLVKHGARPYRLLVNETGLPPEQVKKSLSVLIQLGHVVYCCDKRFVQYDARLDRILLHTRYPRYIYCAKSLYGDAGELIIEELLQNGHMLMSEVVTKVWQRLLEAGEQNKVPEENMVRQTFVDLVNTHFLQRAPTVNSENASKENSIAPQLIVPVEEMYKIPRGMEVDNKINVRKRKLSDDGSSNPNPSKKLKTEPAIDKGIYWCVNFDRFHQYMRDQAIVAAIKRRIDENAASIVQTMLRVSEVTTSSQAEVTNPVAIGSILEALPKEPVIGQNSLNQYLKILVEDQTEFISKYSTSGGGMYVVNIYKAMRELCIATLGSTVQERFGQKSYRIFKLLLMKKYLEQKQIEDFALIPAKEAKEMLYKLFSEQLIAVQEIPRTPDYAPSRTFFLFNVNVDQVCRNVLERSYKSIVNLMLRRNHETQANKRVIEKSQKVESIAASFQNSGGADAAQTAEIEDMITPGEAVQLKRHKENIAKLEKSEIQVDEAIFILTLYLELKKNHRT